MIDYKGDFEFQDCCASLKLGHRLFRYTDPSGMELEEGADISRQLEYLENIVNAEYSTLQDKADAAKNLRNEMRNLNPDRFDIDGLISGKKGDEIFMNETLRDFLNTSDTGLDYNINDMDASLGCNERSEAGSSEHQSDRDPKYKNRKFVNDLDGREAVFTYKNGNWVLSKNSRDKGTYNYAKNTSRICWDWTQWSEHGRWDMAPYFRQYHKTMHYWLYLPNRYGYGKNSRARGI